MTNGYRQDRVLYAPMIDSAMYVYCYSFPLPGSAGSTNSTFSRVLVNLAGSLPFPLDYVFHQGPGHGNHRRSLRFRIVGGDGGSVFDALVVGILPSGSAKHHVRTAESLRVEPDVVPVCPADEIVILAVVPAHNDLQSGR